MLRHISPTSVVVWIELTATARISLELFERKRLQQTVSARSFRVGTRHYALIAVRNLRPRTWYTYRIRAASASGARLIWPDPTLGVTLPPSEFQTPSNDALSQARITFVSCRLMRTFDDEGDEDAGVDALVLLAKRLQKRIRSRGQSWPQALLMVGDQIYADNPSPAQQEKLAASRAGTDLPEKLLIAFEEHCEAYEEAWSQVDLRWLLSCIPSFMIFDDHEVIDDWNISDRWREEMADTSWWGAKYSSALLAYWIYQGAGNLHPDEWEQDERMRAMLPRTHTGRTDATGSLATLFLRYALTSSAPRWSYAVDIGQTRLVVADLRYRRDLNQRLIMDEGEWQWFSKTALDSKQQHLLLVSSLPFLLPDAIHELETSSEASNSFPWNLNPVNLVLDALGVGPDAAREKVDLEHWSAFSKSFNQMLDLLEELRSPGRTVPRFIAVLSGDVHFSYSMVGRLAKNPLRPIHQLVSSGARRKLDSDEATIISLISSPVGSAAMSLARGVAAGFGTALLPVNPQSASQKARLDWGPSGDPSGWLWFGNFVATLSLAGGRMECVYEQAHRVTGLDEDPTAVRYANRRLLPRGRVRDSLL
jgi:hypothetical protein